MDSFNVSLVMLFHALVYILACTEHVPKGKNVCLQASMCESRTGLHQAGSPFKLWHQCFFSQGFQIPIPESFHLLIPWSFALSFVFHTDGVLLWDAYL